MPKSKFKSKYLKNKEKENSKMKGGRHFFDCKTEAELLAIVTKLEQAWALGCSDTEAAFYAGVGKTNVCRYLKSSKKIRERKELLKSNPIMLARQTVVEAISDVVEIDKKGKPKVVRYGNPKIALKFLERVKRDEFALRQENINTTAEAPDIILEDAVPKTKTKKKKRR